MAADEWVPAARLMRPQGRRGELLADPHAEFSSFVPGQSLWLAPAEDAAPNPSGERILEAVWQPTGKNAGRVVLKLAGVESISEAEALAGQFLLLRAADLPALEDDTFRVRDLVGCSLYDGDRLAGIVTDVQFPIGADGHTRLTDAPDLLAVEPAANTLDAAPNTTTNDLQDAPEPVLIPFVRAWLVAVDVDAKRIVMNLPPGLFEDATVSAVADSA